MPFSIVTARVKLDETGATKECPLLVCQFGPVVPVVDYCLSAARSLSWQEKVTRAAKKFCEYLEAHAEAGEEEWRIFRNFSIALHLGSIDLTTGFDHSGLYWESMNTRDAARTIKHLSDMFDWLSREYATKSIGKFNPRYAGNLYDKRIDRLAYIHRRSKAFLGHTWNEEVQADGYLTRARRARYVIRDRPPMFPEERFEELLFKGFVVGGKPDYRGMLIALLMFGGGLRVSEPFHLYIPDIQPGLHDPSIAFVAVHHPEDGYAPYQWKNHLNKIGTRSQYLAANFGLAPRNTLRRDAGWKHNAEDGEGYMQVHWFPEVYGQWFMQIWKLYLPILAGVERHHPYAFINLKGPRIGAPYTVKQFQRAFDAAVERIGLTPRKKDGTTCHGCRHSYAQRLIKCGVHEINIQRLMHHCSIESQKVYTAPEKNQIRKALEEASKTLASRSERVPESLILENFIEE